MLESSTNHEKTMQKYGRKLLSQVHRLFLSWIMTIMLRKSPGITLQTLQKQLNHCKNISRSLSVFNRPLFGVNEGICLFTDVGFGSQVSRIKRSDVRPVAGQEAELTRLNRFRFLNRVFSSTAELKAACKEFGEFIYS